MLPWYHSTSHQRGCAASGWYLLNCSTSKNPQWGQYLSAESSSHVQLTLFLSASTNISGCSVTMEAKSSHFGGSQNPRPQKGIIAPARPQQPWWTSTLIVAVEGVTSAHRRIFQRYTTHWRYHREEKQVKSLHQRRNLISTPSMIRMMDEVSCTSIDHDKRTICNKIYNEQLYWLQGEYRVTTSLHAW